jgi:hypothetical protein
MLSHFHSASHALPANYLTSPGMHLQANPAYMQVRWLTPDQNITIRAWLADQY